MIVQAAQPAQLKRKYLAIPIYALRKFMQETKVEKRYRGNLLPIYTGII